MFPDLVDIGFLHIHTYGACMAVGFLLCWKLVERLSGRRDLSNLILALMASGVLGSRAAYVIEHWSSEFASRPAAVVEIWNGGLMFYGGLILAVVTFFAWCILRREDPLRMADLFATVIPLGHACGRIGCFFYGCCYGRQSGSALAVAFPSHSPAWHEQVRAGLIAPSATASLPVLPTQLFEAAGLLVLFAGLLALHARRRAAGGRGLVSPAGAYLCGYAAIRFGLEMLRGDPRAEVGPLSISQTISLALVVAGAVFIAVDRRRAAAGRTEG